MTSRVGRVQRVESNRLTHLLTRTFKTVEKIASFFTRGTLDLLRVSPDSVITIKEEGGKRFLIVCSGFLTLFILLKWPCPCQDGLCHIKVQMKAIKSFAAKFLMKRPTTTTTMQLKTKQGFAKQQQLSP